MGASEAVIAAQMIANAIKASGTVVRIEPAEFEKILKKLRTRWLLMPKGA